MGDQRRGIQLSLLDQPQDLGTVAAVHPARFEDQVLSVHLRQGQHLRLVVQRHHRHNGIGPGATPRQLKGILRPGHLQHHIGAAVVAVLPHKCLTFLRPAQQHIGVMLPHKGTPRRVLLAQDHPLRGLQQDAQQGADARRPRPDDQHGILRGDLRNACRPKAGGQNIPHKQRLLITNTVGDLIQSPVGIGHPHILRLAPVDAAAQRPAAVGVGAVIHPAVPAEVALPAKGLHIHRYPVARAHRLHRRSDSLHDAHHLMPHGNAGDGPRHRTVLDMQVAGADRPQRHLHNGVTGVLQRRLRLLQKGEPFV